MMIELCSRRFKIMIFIFCVEEYQPTLDQTGIAIWIFVFERLCADWASGCGGGGRESFSLPNQHNYAVFFI
jgi:hypothetical protein